jgi:hypothetical protein
LELDHSLPSLRAKDPVCCQTGNQAREEVKDGLPPLEWRVL